MSLHRTEIGDSGSRVVFCHGLFGQGKNWTQIAKALGADHRVMLLDMPNHGRSPWTEGFDYVELADLVAAELGDEPVALVGHSMGGKIAMCLALRHPQLVERLAVVDVAPVAYESGREFVGYIETMRAMDLGALERRDQADEALRDVGAERCRAQLPAAEPAADRGRLALAGQPRPAGQRTWPTSSAGRARQLGDASYDGPVLWVGGANSDYIADEHAVEMDRRFPRNRRVLVKGAGHWVHSEQPEIFLEVMRRFLP